MNEHSSIHFTGGFQKNPSTHYTFKGTNTNGTADCSRNLIIDAIRAITSTSDEGVITNIEIKVDFIPHIPEENHQNTEGCSEEHLVPTSVTRLMSTTEMKDLITFLDSYASGKNHTQMVLPQVKGFIDLVMPKICTVWNSRIIHTLLDLSQNMLLCGDTVHFVDLNRLFDTLDLRYHIDETLEADELGRRYIVNPKD